MQELQSLEDGLDKINSIKNRIMNSKYLVARKEYLSFCSGLERLEELGAKDLYESLKFELGRADEVVQEMLKKCEHIDAALKHTSEPVENSEWIFGSECDGTTTHYILEYDGTISLHVRGILTDVPLFEQLCVIYEIGLYSQWVPFCSESHMLKQIGHTEFLASVQMYTPFGISRDVVVHAFGANCMSELNAIVIVTKSVEEYEGADIPRVSGGFFNGRCEVKHMYAVTYLLSPTSAEFVCVMKMDPKFRVPQTIMSWFIKQLVGVVLPLLKKQAKYIAAHPEDAAYAEQISRSAELYLNFLLPEFRAYIQARGWEQPVIGCLGEGGRPVPGADYTQPLYQSLCGHIRSPSADTALGSPARQQQPQQTADGLVSIGYMPYISPTSHMQGIVPPHFMRRLSGRSGSMDSVTSSVASYYSCCEDPSVSTPAGMMTVMSTTTTVTTVTTTVSSSFAEAGRTPRLLSSGYPALPVCDDHMNGLRNISPSSMPIPYNSTGSAVDDDGSDCSGVVPLLRDADDERSTSSRGKAERDRGEAREEHSTRPTTGGQLSTMCCCRFLLCC